jgi:hypothetical protein
MRDRPADPPDPPDLPETHPTYPTYPTLRYYAFPDVLCTNAFAPTAAGDPATALGDGS